MNRPLSEYRALFPALAAQGVYLNHAGVAPPSTRVRAAVLEWLEDVIAHGIRGENEWEARAENVRGLAAKLLGSSPGEIAFVRSTSHGLGLVAEGLDWRPGDEVAICPEVEYPSNVYPWRHLAVRGVAVREVPAVRGGMTPEALSRAIGPRTRLVAVSSVQYASGHATDLPAISRVCREAGALLCVDGIQSVGAFPLDVRAAGIDFLSADSHKWLLGLNGIGLLYVRQEVLDRVRPVLVGWKSTTDAWNFNRVLYDLKQDAGKFEEGSPSYLGIYGLGATIELLLEIGVDRIADRIRSVLARLEAGLAGSGAEVSPRPQERAGIVLVRVGGREEALFGELSGKGFSVSLRRGAIRISPHFYTTDDEIDRLVEAIRAFSGRV